MTTSTTSTSVTPHQSDDRTSNRPSSQGSSALLSRLENSLSLISESKHAEGDSGSLEIVERMISDVVALAESSSEDTRKRFDRAHPTTVVAQSTDEETQDGGPSRLAKSQEAEYETTCINLLSKVEHATTKIGIARKNDQYYEITRLAESMLVALLDFSNRNLDGCVESIQSVTHAYGSTRAFDKYINDQEWRLLRRMFGLSVLTEFEFKKAHHDLREEFARLIEGVFDAAASRFSTPATADNLRDNVASLTAEMRQSW